MREALDVPAPAGLPFSAAVRAGKTLYLSGQVGIDVKTMTLVASDAKGQTAQILRNIKDVLKADGKSLDDIVKANVYLIDLADYAAMNEAYASALKEPFPARTCVQVAALPLGARVEIEVIAR